MLHTRRSLWIRIGPRRAGTRRRACHNAVGAQREQDVEGDLPGAHGFVTRSMPPTSSESSSTRPHGIRSLSRFHAENPYVFRVEDQEYRVPYLPAESDTGVFGGNSNWRGPIWMPVNVLIIRALLQYYAYYGDE
jgi:hypothetical protein